MSIVSKLKLRKAFGRMKGDFQIPNLIELQKKSYEKFLQKDVDPEKRDFQGLQAVFKSVFPISDYKKTISLEFVKYSLQHPKYDVDECRQRKITYASPLKTTLRLVVFDTKEGSDERTVRDVKEQEVYLGEVPLMTDNGSFIINGTERVIVSQLHRSPGVFFDHDGGKNNLSGKLIYSARVIPYRGSWLDFEFDNKDLIYVRIDRKKKFPATILLKGLGYNVEELLKEFYNIDQVNVDSKGKFFMDLHIERMLGQKVLFDIKNNKGEVFVKAGRRVTRALARQVQKANIKKVQLTSKNLYGAVLAKPLVDFQTGEILSDSNSEITEESLERALKANVKNFNVIFFDGLTVGPYLCNTLLVDKVATREEAVQEIYKRMKPGEPPSLDIAEPYFNNLFFNPEMYDLGEVGRLKINHRFNIPFDKIPITTRTLEKDDFIRTVRTMVDLKNGRGQVDDIDHLGNRRIRSVGELLENQYRIGLVRMERVVRDRMNLQDKETVMPHDLINAKSLNSVVKEFFGSSQLSQFMDQTNPLAEVTHKRRLSALGPGGLTRDRAGFEVRDVHPTHYGRICPIETPEGPNIGLIASLATFARIDDHGFIETPYYSIKNNKVTKSIRYVSALEEEKHCIAQVSSRFDELTPDQNVMVRESGEYKTVKKEEVSMMDVSSGQLVSVGASLIPFLEHDDANRALMGSNMQRQAVPLMKAKAPLVGTGVEYLVARDSGTSVVSRTDGEVEVVDSSQIVIRRRNKEGKLGASLDIYNLTKYQRTNQNTCFNQRPIVRKGDTINKGDILADGPSTHQGELALGQNIVVAFTPFEGYNFEDSILISERLIRDDVYTSIHIEEFECVARDTKLGKEEITPDIANVGEEALRDLDSSGIIQVGSKVKPGDILVGKITPKGESQVSPEKKLLLAIFGEKAGEFRDTSLRASSGVTGTVIDTQVYSREGIDKDERLQDIIKEKKKKLKKDFELEQNVIRNNALDKIQELVVGKKTKDIFLNDDASEELLKKGQTITTEDLDKIPFELLGNIPLSDDKISDQLYKLTEAATHQLDAIDLIYKDKQENLLKGDDMPPGVIKVIKVYVAVKRTLQVGDKFAGRHGNKGVISKILPVEDMPYLADGTPVDMVLNPLGVPSRMNIGQILETHLGWAAYGLGVQLRKYLDNFDFDSAKKDVKNIFSDETSLVKKINQLNEKEMKEVVTLLSDGIRVASPVFDGAKEDEVKQLLEKAKLPLTGQTVLFHGATGEPFRMPVTVGVMYMLKLHHLVEEKIHARSTGPYSLVSQQPLGGKAQFGGQRLGEMEVWAIEAYGAAYCLQEFLTVKSDDVAGRTRMYESIIKGENVLEPGIPEAFNVLVKELQSLALDVDLVESDLLTEQPQKTKDVTQQ